MKIEVSIINLSSVSLGIFIAEGEDDIGEFSMLTLGFFLFSIDIFIYNQQINIS
jgi:hypothetical protein